ncbi:mitotic checkpoint serine/threonine-protein kinase BUB1-like [Urocitellus parryii]
MDNPENVFQMFEAHMQSYKGNDPLGEWESYMQWVEENFPDNKDYLIMLLEHLMKEFLVTKRYHNDPRFINYCLKFAEYNSDPHQFFEFLYNQGIGIQSSPLYISWAGHLEAQGELQQASAVFRRGIQNQAEPQELLQQQYSYGDLGGEPPALSDGGNRKHGHAAWREAQIDSPDVSKNERGTHSERLARRRRDS